ncbi:MAG: winged helix-turn-helix domain-containing protein [Flavobacteriaceae bacterium]
MDKRRIGIYVGIIALLGTLWFFLDSEKNRESKPEDIKVALREVGHKILWVNRDSSSLVKPIKRLENLRYRVTFEKEISIEPERLVNIVKQNFIGSNLPGYYIVEVVQCVDGEVAYSYKMRNEEEKNIVPCKGRTLPKGCYALEVNFLKGENTSIGKKVVALLLGLMVLFMVGAFLQDKSKKRRLNRGGREYISLGNYLFYPKQNKLVLHDKETLLSKKEGELLAILTSHLNQVVKREDLVKKVWEDKGVVVGRSLDTYISKLRKKLKEDPSIKLTNVHGVGYKLEIF